MIFVARLNLCLVVKAKSRCFLSVYTEFYVSCIVLIVKCADYFVCTFVLVFGPLTIFHFIILLT